MSNILVMGGDERMIHAARILSADTLFLGENADISKKYDAIVLPMPLSRDGASVVCPIEKTRFPFADIIEYAEENARIFAGGNSPALARLCREKGFTLENYSESETLALKNAKLTAEAAVMLFIQHSPGSLLGSTVLITGYGRIARFMARELSAFGCDVIIAARRPEARVLAELEGSSAVDIDGIADVIGECDYIANTVPAQLFPENVFAKIKEWTILEELATLPQEPTKSLCEKYGGRYVFAGGLPGKFSPEAAGKFIAEEIGKRCSS
ncbi:MAG: hypothetical protein J1F28_03440 [Oscillospiraceae bacterium]|nr:hypothetical protein [Oscillospiraceae bacterium]